jgi:hypothetical protein
MEGDDGLTGGGESRAPQVAHERSLFEVLQRMVKTICQMAHNGKQLQIFAFDFADKDGKPIRATLTLMRSDIDVGPPIVVLEPKTKETVVYGTRQDGSYRSPGNWTDALEAEYQALVKRLTDYRYAWDRRLADPETGREMFLRDRAQLIADGWAKVK